MNHIFNCKAAKANTPTYEPLQWKTLRSHCQKISSDTDPWDPGSRPPMCLDVPHHTIDLTKSLTNQKWIGDLAIPDAVRRMTKALCICDVFFGFGTKDGVPVRRIDPFYLPEDFRQAADSIRPVRPGTAVPRSKHGISESELQEKVLFEDN